MGTFDPDGDEPVGVNRYVATDAAPVNTCDVRHMGEGPDAPPEDWHTRSRRVGTLSFDPTVYSDFPSDAFAPRGHDVIVGFVLDPGTSASLAIAPESLDSAAFIDLAAFRPPGGPNEGIVELVPSIGLEACPTVETLFGVGMTVTDAQCALVDISSPGRQVTRIALSFGMGACPEPAVPVLAQSKLTG